jgi:Protein of unknown function (DUF998)
MATFSAHSPVRLPSRSWPLLLAGAAAGPLFVAAFVAEGATRPGYDPLRHPVSSLSLGRRGWRQTANFTLTGALYLAGAVGLWRTRDRAAIEPVLIGAAGVGLLGAAAFRTDPISGYPPETPALTDPRTSTGIAHDLSAIPVFLGIPVAAFVEAVRARRAGRPRWALASTGSGAGMLAFLVLSSAGFGQQPSLVRFGGLFQRASIVAGLGWITALMLRALRR